jgi:hypothetical protein
MPAPTPESMERGPMFGGGVGPSVTIVVKEAPPLVLFSSVYVVFRFSAPSRMLKKVDGSPLV